jgi:nitrite reductase (NADH) small subunit
MKEAKLWFRIARCQDIPLREGRAVTVASRTIAIFNLGDRFLAVENRCPHKGGPLADGIVSGSTVVCPLHAWKFSLATGEGLNSLSASHCVETFPTRAQHGFVFVEMSDVTASIHEDKRAELTMICAKQGTPSAGDMPLVT